MRWGPPTTKPPGPTPVPALSPRANGREPWRSRSRRHRRKSGRGWSQMGWNRGGWYSWDRLDNAGRPSATQVHPEWQDLAVGDHLQGWSPSGLLAPWEVAALEPDRF